MTQVIVPYFSSPKRTITGLFIAAVRVIQNLITRERGGRRKSQWWDLPFFLFPFSLTRGSNQTHVLETSTEVEGEA